MDEGEKKYKDYDQNPMRPGGGPHKKEQQQLAGSTARNKQPQKEQKFLKKRLHM